jgi:hypothetical protein
MLKINSKIKCINCHNIPSDEKFDFLSNYKNKISNDQLKILDNFIKKKLIYL